MQKFSIGREGAPLLVVDDFAEDPDGLVRRAVPKHFTVTTRSFPGLRTKAPRSYRHELVERLKETLVEFFELDGRSLSFSMCHYSVVTTPPGELSVMQRIPHIDSVDGSGLATVHYLFRKPLGGTAFYRHRKTGFEYVDAARKDAYFTMLQEELEGPDAPPAAYIKGDTPLFERIAEQEGVFNRLLVYRRNSLHSGCINADFAFDPNPLTGRLSINSFIDVGP